MAHKNAFADLVQDSDEEPSSSQGNSILFGSKQAEDKPKPKPKPQKIKNTNVEENESDSDNNNTSNINNAKKEKNKKGKGGPVMWQPQTKTSGEKEKAKRIPIKVERSMKTREHDIASGIADSLRTFAMKKKLKEMKKKLKKEKKKNSLSESDDDSQEEDDQEEEEQEEENNNNNTKGKQSNQQNQSNIDQSEDSTLYNENEENDMYSYEEQDLSDPESLKSYRKNLMIQLLSENHQDLIDPLYAPLTSFQQLKNNFFINSELYDNLVSKFKYPTPIQQQCWPILLSGKDCIGIAYTGSGKTLAFMVPAINKIYNHLNQHDKSNTENNVNNTNNTATVNNDTPSVGPVSPLVLVLSPTRELALQTQDVCSKLPAISSSFCIIGGPDLEGQKTGLIKKNPNIAIATPGRLTKIIEMNGITLNKIFYFVLDEADRMLDLGFEKEINQILTLLPPTHLRQTALFSATWPPHIQSMVSRVMGNKNVLQVKIGLSGEDAVASKHVKQIIEIIDRRGGARERRLLELLEQYHASRANRIILFVMYKREADDVAALLTRKGFNVAAIHGDKSQSQRENAIQNLRSGSCPLLVASDVAARGIDVPDITHVINFSLGLSVEHYIHRIGRTGRGNSTGVSHTFFVPEWDTPHAPQLCQVLRDAEQVIPQGLIELADRAITKARKHQNEQQSHGDAKFINYKQKKLNHSDEDDDDDNDDDDGEEEEENPFQTVYEPMKKKQHPSTLGKRNTGRRGRGNRH